MSAEPVQAVEAGEVVTPPPVPAVPQPAGPVRLTFDGDAIRVGTADARRYLRYAKRAFARCRRPKKYGGNPCTAKPGTPEATAAFERGVLIPLRDWCRANADRVAACYCAEVWSERPEFYVERRRTGIDSELEVRAGSLDQQLFDAGWSVMVFSLGPVGGAEIPSGRFNSARAMVFDAQR